MWGSIAPALLPSGLLLILSFVGFSWFCWPGVARRQLTFLCFAKEK
jgi:hypothetical protein